MLRVCCFLCTSAVCILFLFVSFFFSSTSLTPPQAKPTSFASLLGSTSSLLLYLSNNKTKQGNKFQNPVSWLIGLSVSQDQQWNRCKTVQEEKKPPSRMTSFTLTIFSWWSSPTDLSAEEKLETTRLGSDDATPRYQSPRLVVHLLLICCGRIFSVPPTPASSLRQLPALLPICRLKFGGHHLEECARRRVRAHIIEEGETNYSSTGKLFCLVLPCWLLLSLSLSPPCSFPLSPTNRWAILMKSALPVPICVRNEFHLFFFALFK